MKSLEMRKRFFDFFEKRGHTKVRSSSLIPAQDPTLLFSNAGMNQFKDVFLGKEQRTYTRAVSIQKCMRAGGKHSDLDNVGFTSRHLTFFEMMGNFSFGDYFKVDAIQFAWDFLTQEMQFDPKTMYATVFREDDESYNIWLKTIGLPPERISRLDEDNNFWQMGDTGPCGPCSEIYIDKGKEQGCGQTSCAPGCSCDRFLEVWNLVFMQYDRQPNGQDKPLAKTGVDTGMGLERLCVIAQDKNSVFETDLFEPIIAKIEQLTNTHYYTSSKDIQAAYNVLCDHVRSASFLIADGATPSNEGRGYVLRKIIRRAALFLQKLSKKNILPELANVVIDTMAPIYPELKDAQTSITHILTLEVDKFAHNLIQGQGLLKELIAKASGKTISGKQAFRLYDTFGFPLELTRVIAGEQGFTVDIQEFDQEMASQKERSSNKITKEQLSLTTLPTTLTTQFTGYEQLSTPSTISGIILNNELQKSAPSNSLVWIITQQSPFYVEKGGQVSDKGWVIVNNERLPILGLQRIDNAIAVLIEASSELNVGMPIVSEVDKHSRLDIMNNHTATHLLQAALIEVLGKEVKQSGSLVHPDYLRFDFTYHKALSPEQLTQVENRINEKIRENIPLSIYETSYEDALSKGVIAIFGEKYNPERVRVIDIPSFSKELCGGTHVQATGDIGCFKITQEMALSTGQRRIVALTGRKAFELFQQDFSLIKDLTQLYKVPTDELQATLEKHQLEYKNILTALKKLKKQNWDYQLPTWLNQLKSHNEIPYTILEIPEASLEELRDIAQLLADKKPGVYCLINSADNKTSFVCTRSTTLKESVASLKPLAQIFSTNLDLKGGGKDDSIQGGGPHISREQLETTLKKWIDTL